MILGERSGKQHTLIADLDEADLVWQILLFLTSSRVVEILSILCLVEYLLGKAESGKDGTQQEGGED